MDIKITKKNSVVSLVFENSNREFRFSEVSQSNEINTKGKMTLKDVIQSIYLAGKNNDLLFVEQETSSGEN